MTKYRKLAFKTYKKHIPRFIAIMAIIILSIGLVTGVGACTFRTIEVANKYYQEANVSDIVVKSSSLTGFSESEIQTLENRYGKENISKQTFMEFDDNTYRIHCLDFDNNNVNTLKLKDGAFPTNSNEVVAERSTDGIKDFKVGEKITLMAQEYTVSGIVINPYYFCRDPEPLLRDTSKNVSGIFYANKSSYMPTNDIYIKTSYRSINAMDDEYISHANMEKEWVLANISDATVLTLEQNKSFNYIFSYSEKISLMAWIVLVAFIVVAALVIFIIISRLIEEERATSATLKTLGYNVFKISRLFFRFSFFATLFGIALSWPVGYGLTELIYYSFNTTFNMPNIFVAHNNFFYMISSLIMLIVALLTSIIVSFKCLKEKPADMLRPRSPKEGKRILLEKIPSIWNKMSFKKKCIAKNLFRKKSQLLLTIFSIIGTAALVLVGSGLFSYTLYDNSKGPSLRAICIVIMLFAFALTGVIIYILSNINISERKREIATFMVLGYHDKEVEDYIFKEIYIMSLFGAIIGTPIGALILHVIFEILNFGGMDQVAFWVYIITPGLILLFTFLVTQILKKKIDNVDMNESLKSIE